MAHEKCIISYFSYVLQQLRTCFVANEITNVPDGKDVPLTVHCERGPKHLRDDLVALQIEGSVVASS